MAKKEEAFSCEACPLYAGITAAKRLRREVREAIPQGFQEHARSSCREQLLAMRSLIDAAADRLEQKPKRTVKTSKIEVQ